MARQGRCFTCYDYWTCWETGDKVYELCLSDDDGSYRMVSAYCDMSGGGYTYISQIVDGTLNFNASWKVYEESFGIVGADSSHWLGLRAMHLLTNHCGQSQARIELGTTCTKYGTTSVYEEFDTFQVGNSSSQYRLTMSGPSGTAGDGDFNLAGDGGINGKPFSTIDAGHDRWSGNCAATDASGWWYDYCAWSKLTGTWFSDCEEHSVHGVYWQTWHGYDSLQRATLKVRSPP